MLTTITVILYLFAWSQLILSLYKRSQIVKVQFLAIVGVGLLFHIAAVSEAIRTDGRYLLGIAQVAPLFMGVINTIVILSTLRKPLVNLFVFLLPLSVIALLMGIFSEATTKVTSGYSLGIMSHILLSITAYSLLTIATMQALILAYQNHKLRHKHPGGLLGLLPPLQTMETLLFEIIFAGQALLTLSILTGLIFIDNILAQQLAHKTVFSFIAWLMYSTLLVGRYAFGWRGNYAIRWTLGGFLALMTAYFGTKFVIEIILN